MNEVKQYDLKASVEGVGKLVPVLKDAQGNVIDGFHRQQIDPEWPSVKCETVDNPTKLALARLASNFCRRQVGKEELQEAIVFLIGKAGLKPQDIADQTGIGLTTIYLHMPEHLKDKAKAEAGKKGGEARATSLKQSRKIQDMPPLPPQAEHPVKCDLCPIETGTWFPYRLKDGRVLCPVCFKDLWVKGEVTEADLLKPGEKPQAPPEKPKPKPQVKEYKPKESWTHRKAVMQPQHSNMEQALLIKLQTTDHHPVTDRTFCLQSTTPDFYFPKQNLAIYIDGPVHEGKEERDDILRELLAKRHGIRIVSIPYKAFTKQETERVFNEIVTAIKEA